MFAIAIIRRGNDRPTIDKNTIAAVSRRIDGPKVRVKRPGIAGLFIPAKGRKVSAFYGLPMVPSAIVNNAAALVADGPDGTDVPFSESWIARCAYTVPASDLGKYGRESELEFVDGEYRESDPLAKVADANSCRNSIRLWIDQNLGPVVNMDDVSIIHYIIPE